MRVYLGIEFGKVFTGTFSEFKDVYGSTHVFKKFQPKQREHELKAAYQVATSEPKEAVKEGKKAVKVENSNGNTSRSITESKETDSGPTE